MTTAPVSVVIPCFRSASTIARAVRSVHEQTVRPAEVIVVDDGSKDATLEVVDELRHCYGRTWLKVITLERNAGPSTARNRGWDSATQPFLAFLDSDDAWHARKIERQYYWMRERPGVGLTGHRYTWFRDGEVNPLDALADRRGNDPPVRQLSLRELLLFSPFPTPSVMVRTSLPHRFDETKRRDEDGLLWLQIVAAGTECWMIDVPLCRLYKAPWGAGGLSRSNFWMWLARVDSIWKLRRTGRVPTLLTLHALLKNTAHHLIRQTFSRP